MAVVSQAATRLRKESGESRRRRTHRKERLCQIASVILLALAWEWVGRSTDPLLFPPLTRVAAAWVEIVASGELPRSLMLSVSALILGLGLSLVVGISAGVVMGWFRRLEHVSDTLLTLVLVVPTVGLVPVLVIAFGLGLEVRVATVFLFTVPIVGLNCYSGTKTVDLKFIEMARSFGARDWHLLTKVVLPAAVPGIMAGVRLGIGRATVGMVTAELLVVSVGIGLLMSRFSALLLTSKLYATVLTVIAIGVLVTAFGQWLDRLVSRRHGRQQAFNT